MKMRMLVVSSMLGFGLVGCGGINAAEEPADNSDLQSVEQLLCNPPTDSSGGCVSGTLTQVSSGLTCSHFGFDFTYTCSPVLGSGCVLLRCVSGNNWGTKTISGDCTQAVQNWCS